MTDAVFEIDPDIRLARTLPARVYSDPDLFGAQRARDLSDRIHCFSNVCTHRGTPVVEGAGHQQQLRCRYHGRRFTLDGRFHSMPEFEGTANFPSPAVDLPRVALGCGSASSWSRSPQP